MRWDTLWNAAFLVSSSLATGAAAASQPEDVKTRLAIELMQATHYDRNIQKGIDRLEDALAKEDSSNGSCEASRAAYREFSNALVEKAAASLRSEELQVKIGAYYASAFSEDELRGIVAFYQSPLGRKLADRMPEISKQAERLSEKFHEQFRPELQKIGEQYRPIIQEAAKTCETASAKPSGEKK
ncbi:MAG: DUF2059 domain-containing protein [Dokdonella sp.]